MSRYDLTDFEWRVIEPLLPNKPRGVPRVDDRRPRRRHPDDRKYLHPGAPAGCDGKKGSDHCFGRSRGGLTTKVHVVVDAQGLPIRLCPTAWQAHDEQIADHLLNHFGPRTILLADKANEADRTRELIQDQGATPNIAPKSNQRWKPYFSKRLCRERKLVERFFSKLKHFRRVATATTSSLPTSSP